MRKSLFSFGSMLFASAFIGGCGGGGEGDVEAESAEAADVTSSKAAAVALTSTAAALPADAIFAPTSFWYQQIPINTPLHANSAGFLADFLRQKAAYYNTVGINLTSWASPVYSVPSNLPTKKINQWQ